jgi:hypothetical protein
MILNVMANAFGVPLVLTSKGKVDAIAVKALERFERSAYDPSPAERGRTASIVEQVVGLEEAGDLDPVLGGYGVSQRTRILES